MRRLIPILTLLLVAWLPASAATAYTITLNSGGTSELVTQSRAGFGGNAFERLNPAALPYGDTSTVADGTASAHSVLSLTNNGFFVSFDHARTANLFSQSQTYGRIYFSSDEDVDFDISGSYDASDSDGRRIQLITSLRNQTTSADVFNFNQRSDSTPDESFTVGGSGGDSLNTVIGATAGTLFAGQMYQFDLRTLLQAAPTASITGATASGSVTLNFTAIPPPIPEPGTATLIGFGLIGLSASRRRGPIARA